MKKYLINIRNIIFYGLTYVIMQGIIGFCTSFIYGMKHSDLGKEALVRESQLYVQSNIYIVLLISAVLTVLIYYLVLKNREKTLFERISFKKINKAYIGRIIIAIIGAVAFSCSFVLILKDKFPSYDFVSNSIQMASNSKLAMISIIVFIPIFEEILFRGLIFYELRKNMNIILAIIIQAAIFGVFHGNAIQIMYAFILGIILGVTYYFTESLWANILGHIIYNLLGTIVFPIILSMTKNFVYGYIILGLSIVIISIISMSKQYKKNKQYLDEVSL